MRKHDFNLNRVVTNVRGVTAHVRLVDGGLDMDLDITLTKDEWNLMAKHETFSIQSQYVTVVTDVNNKNMYIKLNRADDTYAIYFADDPGFTYLAQEVLGRLES